MKPLLFVLAAATAQAGAPAVYWHSAPTKPGETLQLFGGDWGAKPALVCKTGRLEPVKKTETGLWFTLPAAWKDGIRDCTVVSEGGASAPFAVRGPDVWWVQGARGNEVEAGGEVRVFGRELDVGGKAEARLAADDGRRFALQATLRDTWQIRACLPAALPCGDYALELSNGLADESGKARFVSCGNVRVAPKREVWKETRFDVTAFGAVPNDRRDDTLAIAAALAAAEKNGGGTVFFPRGRYQVSETLRIPPFTLLKGEGRNLASLYWLDCEKPPEALLLGTHSFGIEDLFIHSANYCNGLMLDTALARKHSLTSTRTMVSHDVTLRRCKFKFIVDQWYCYSRSLFEKRYFQRGNGIDLRDVRNLVVEDCDVYASKEDMSTLYFLVTGENVIMRRCRINGHGWSVIGGDRVIFEENESLNCTYSISKISRNFYFGRNKQYDLFNNNRESVTHDGAMTAFTCREGRGYHPGYTVGGKADGRRVQLIFDKCKEKGNVNEQAAFWKGYELQIVAGRGVGQTRRITQIESYAAPIEIDRPFDVAPDATSRFVICAERRHLLYADNDTEDSSYAIQLYGGVTDCVLARNHCRRAGGFRGEGRNYHGIIPCWCVQFVGNVVEEGNGYRDVANSPVPGDSVVGAVVATREIPLTRAYVLRDNVLENNARFEVSCLDALVENNVVRNADVGVDAAEGAATVFCRGNRFENVKRRFASRFLDAADMPEEKAQLAAERRARLAQAAGGRQMLTADEAQDLLGVEVTFLPWQLGVRRVVASEAPGAKEALKLDVHVGPGATGAVLTVAADVKPEETKPWRFAPSAKWKLNKEGLAHFDYPYAVEAGPRGLFTLPLLCTLDLPDGRRFTWRTTPKVFVQNRICKWAIARGESPKTGWKKVTHYDPHERIETRAECPGLKPDDKVTVRTILKVNRPVRIDFAAEGKNVEAFDAKHKPMDWNRAAPRLYQPGEYLIDVVKTYRAKGEGDNGVFKFYLRDFDYDVPPGAIEFRLPEGTAER